MIDIDPAAAAGTGNSTSDKYSSNSIVDETKKKTSIKECPADRQTPSYRHPRKLRSKAEKAATRSL